MHLNRLTLWRRHAYRWSSLISERKFTLNLRNLRHHDFNILYYKEKKRETLDQKELMEYVT